MGGRTFRVSKGNLSGAYYNREITVVFQEGKCVKVYISKV